MKKYKYFWLTLAVIIFDQVVKLLVHAYMQMGVNGEVNVLGDWFILHYTLNPGMAFGMELGSEYGKMILSTFRLVAMFGIGYYLYKLIEKHMHPGLLWSVALILGGAIGNVIDSTFYGVFLDNAPYNSPIRWFHGQVIDMLYFPLIEGNFPDWFPIWGGDDFLFFRPVFNVADSCIFIGVALILLRQKTFFKHEKAHENKSETPSDAHPENLEPQVSSATE